MDKMFKDDLYLICLECQNEFVFTGFQQKKALLEDEPLQIPTNCLVCQLQKARRQAKERQNQTLTGRIKWFNHSRGFGFIESDDGDKIFLHHSIVENRRRKKLKKGQYVEFLAEKSQKGLQATELTILSKEQAEAN